MFVGGLLSFRRAMPVTVTSAQGNSLSWNDLIRSEDHKSWLCKALKRSGAEGRQGMANEVVFETAAIRHGAAPFLAQFWKKSAHSYWPVFVAKMLWMAKKCCKNDCIGLECCNTGCCQRRYSVVKIQHSPNFSLLAIVMEASLGWIICSTKEGNHVKRVAFGESKARAEGNLRRF